MVFKSNKFLTAWDTWVYCHEGTFYLYYLITEFSPGEGFGVATSKDGVFWTDHGKQIEASEKMTVYLGTGSVWKSPYFDKDKTFICNYSEWREEGGKNYQNILFAVSFDLIHWTKLGDAKMFCIDRSLYKTYGHEGGRWDCIFPVKKENGGYYGYFTAAPKNYIGCGLAETDDGITWKALPPPRFLIEDKGIKEGLEAGAVCRHGGKYYSIMGTYCNEYGMAVVISDTAGGTFIPQKKNFALLSNRSFMHAYFMRLFEKDGELLVNHHSCQRPVTKYNRWTTYAAPFKKVIFDRENTLRLVWWEGNEKLKGKPLNVLSGNIIAEGCFKQCCKLTLETENGNIIISVEGNGVVTYSDGKGILETCRKDMEFENYYFRLLVKDTMTELYIDGYFITCFTLESPFKGLDIQNLTAVKAWAFAV